MCNSALVKCLGGDVALGWGSVWLLLLSEYDIDRFFFPPHLFSVRALP